MAIVEFVRACEKAVSRLRTLTRLHTLPLTAEKLGVDFLTPTQDTAGKLREALSENAGGPLSSYRAATSNIWKWQFDRDGADCRSYKKPNVSKKFLARNDDSAVPALDRAGALARATTTISDQMIV